MVSTFLYNYCFCLIRSYIVWYAKTFYCFFYYNELAVVGIRLCYRSSNSHGSMSAELDECLDTALELIADYLREFTLDFGIGLR